MRALLSILLFSVLCCSCQDEKNISETLIGEWTYERETSNTFNYLLDFDRSGIMSFNSDGVGVWNQTKGDYNFDIEWIIDEDLQKIIISKFDQDQDLQFVDSTEFEVTKINDMTLMLEFEEETLSPSDPSFYIYHFENILLTRM